MNGDRNITEGALTDTLLKNKSELKEVNVEIPDLENRQSIDEPPVEFVGLRKEELMKYAKDPYWNKLRIILLILLCVVWVSMLAAAIAIIVLAPKCPLQPNLQWWQKGAVIYYLHPRSFKDTDGNGQGDINGIVEKLKYMKDTLGVSAVNVGPLQHSPHINFGYDVSDHKTVCHRYGTLNAFEHLVHEAHKNDMKVIVDFVPNHTSKRHKWFLLSRNKTEGYENFYIWKAGNKEQPPNNWKSVYGGSAWEFDEERAEFYYHAYSKDEPDLNLRNPDVLKQLDEALYFWLLMKVDGVRMVGAQYLVEHPSFDNEQHQADNSSHGHEYTSFQNESYNLITRWRQIIDNFSQNRSMPRSYQYERLLMVSATGSNIDVIKFSNFNETPGAQIASNQLLMKINGDCGAACLCSLINQYLSLVNASDPMHAPNKQIFNWQTGEFGDVRIASRVDADRLLNVFHMLHLLLPGPSQLYYGDEIAMTTQSSSLLPPNSTLTLEQFHRGVTLSPMQWTDGPGAGFTTSNSPWIPINHDYKLVNVRHEMAQGSTKSHVRTINDVTRLIGREASLQWGLLRMFHDADILYWTRAATGYPTIIVVINVGDHAATINLMEGSLAPHIPDKEAEVVLSVHATNQIPSALTNGTKIQLANTIYLRSGDGIVLRAIVAKKLFS